MITKKMIKTSEEIKELESMSDWEVASEACYSKILVQFPFNDYLVRGRCKTYRPRRTLKPRKNGDSNIVMVQFDKAIWRTVPTAVEVLPGKWMITWAAKGILQEL